MRNNYTMTQDQYDAIITAIKVASERPLIMLQYGMPESPQEAAIKAWCELGRQMGFDGMTVKPGRNKFSFSAVCND